MSPFLTLFDIDGTLLLTGGAGRRALERTFEQEFGIADGFEGYSFSGATDPAILRHGFLRWFDRDPRPDESARALEVYLALLDEELGNHPEQVVPLPGVRELLECLPGAGAVVGLATGNVEEGARRKLVAAGIWHHFRYGGFGSDAEHRGELTRIGIERGLAAAAAPVPRDRIWVVGDSPLDVSAARHAGARCLAVLTGWSSRDELETERPDALLRDLSDTAAVLDLLR